nr:MAG TPA_asm: hypothetical protein [Caudoviricetes sp.]
MKIVFGSIILKITGVILPNIKKRNFIVFQFAALAAVSTAIN